jgi:parallel beta-helix repeat protein
MRKTIKIGLLIGITFILLTPLSIVLADDTEPPVITNITYGPHAGVRTDPGFYLYQSCNVTDNVSVSEVRIIITGPIGFTPINNSMVNINGSHYYYEVDNVSLSGTYGFYIWAIDSSNNTVQSNIFYMLVFENYMSYIYVNVNNTAGPWNGTAQHPLQSITDALAVLAPNGTIFIYEGIYWNTSIVLDKSLNLLGENQDTTILDGGGLSASGIVSINGNHLISLANLTLRNAIQGLQVQNGSNVTMSHCTVSQCTDSAVSMVESQHFLVTDCTFQNNNRGIQLTNCSYNQFYHNNFFNNIIPVSTYLNTSFNAWDNGITGNYWDDYRIIYPNANIIPSTGTWNIPYMVNISSGDTDYHPWVYPSGYIDTIPPQVTVIYPQGGEVVSGEIIIRWSASDDLTMNLNGTILLEYSPDNGGSWNQLASNLNNTGAYLWNTTTVPNGNLYLIGVSTIDEFLNIGSDTSNTTFSILNLQPMAPQISGPSQGGNGIPFNFTVVATDPQGKQIYYKFDWGDGNFSDWLGPIDSSVLFKTSYAWATDGNYSIRVKAMNIDGDESNWSVVHQISIAEQINFSNVQLGVIYFKLFSFNRSFIYSNFLAQLGLVIILTSHEMVLEAYATDVVTSVTFRAENQLQIENMEINDDNKTNGFSCVMNVTRGVYMLNITAFDGNGTLIDKYSLATVFFIRIGRYATAPPERALQQLRIIPRLRH